MELFPCVALEVELVSVVFEVELAYVVFEVEFACVSFWLLFVWFIWLLVALVEFEEVWLELVEEF